MKRRVEKAMRTWFVGGTVIVACALPMSLAARARTIWDGVYTEQQAKRAEPVYRENCATCHGATFNGTETAPELIGDAFLKPWYGKSVNDLFKQVMRNMPKDAPGTLTPQQTADSLALIFQANKFPAGSADLPMAAAELSDIKIEKAAK